MSKDLTSVELIDRAHEWAVILAGGDGTRLRPLTRKICGDDRPKQFCPVLGRSTLLEETQRRTALEIAREQTVYVVNRCHEAYYAPILGSEPADNLIVQPSNRGTAPAILYSLMRIATVDSHALVAFFPSDHYISDNRRFMKHVRTALDAAQRRPDLVILLGVAPESPEVEYGWIEPASHIPGNRQLRAVRRFWEKPNHFTAQVLQLRGCLWNSFVMIASAHALQEMIHATIPELYRSFSALTSLLGASEEAAAMEDLYASLEEINFSHEVLTQSTEHLALIEVTGLHWNDLGEPQRVMASLTMAGLRPQWAKAAVSA